MNKPSTAEYQRHRTATLRTIERQRQLEVAFSLAQENRKRGKRYSRKTMRVLKGEA